MITTGKAAEADVAYIDAGKTLRQAGHLMRELGVGALEVRGEISWLSLLILREQILIYSSVCHGDTRQPK